MLAEIGNFSLTLALVVASVQCSVPLLGSFRSRAMWCQMARPAAWVQFALVLFSYTILTYLFLTNDFSVAYIANHSNTRLPWFYRLSAVWSAHEGSLLLWGALLSGWTAAVAWASQRLPLLTMARVLAVLGLVSVGFLSFMLITSNPFERLLPRIPAEGRDINPLLQDPGLIFHPPLLYMGYVGFAVAFAFAIAALLSGQLDRAWIRWMRPWTLIAWSFLTVGIILGSWWAYRELGWGGWWFWDPVENASLLPWLIGTALLHSLIVAEKRGVFKVWTVLLAIAAFSLSLLGTFLVRSGVLTSVHAFASSPERGLFLLLFLLVVVGLSLFIFAWRATALHNESAFTFLSRETLLLTNNIVLLVAMSTLLLGILYPLILDALNGSKISVGAPYFNTVMVPLMMPVFFLMGLGPLTRWREMAPGLLWQKMRFAFLSSVGVSIAIFLVTTGRLPVMTLLGIVLAIWIMMATLAYWIESIRLRWQVTPGWQSMRLPASSYGMIVAHVGVAISVLGIALSTHYSIERDVRMSPGDTVSIHDYSFTFQGTRQQLGPNYTSTLGEFIVAYQGKEFATLYPQKREHFASRMIMTKAATQVTWLRDIYLALAEPIEGSAWAVRIYYKPFVRWIWLGGALMALGAGLAAVASRRHKGVSLGD